MDLIRFMKHLKWTVLGLIAAAAWAVAGTPEKPVNSDLMAAFSGTIKGTVVSKAPNKRWFVLEVKSTEPVTDGVAGQQVTISLTYGADKQPKADQIEFVSKLETGAEVTVAVISAKNKVLRLKSPPDASN
jgi:hypothetical protein